MDGSPRFLPFLTLSRSSPGAARCRGYRLRARPVLRVRHARWGLVALLAAASCTGMSLRPVVGGRDGLSPDYVALMSAEFEVACERCRVEYGVEGSTYHDTTEGNWQGSAPLGTVRTGDEVRVVLRVRPIGEARILSAAIHVSGRTVASSGEKEPGKAVDLWARVGPWAP